MTLPYVYRLHAISLDKGRAYCGPTAIAAITGLHPKGEVRAAVNRVRGRPENRAVCRMLNTETMSVMRNLGYLLMPVYYWRTVAGDLGKRIDWEEPPTLREFIVRMRTQQAMIINVTNHYVAACGRLVVDNAEPDGADVDDHRCRRKRVQRAWIVKRLTTAVEPRLPDGKLERSQAGNPVPAQV